MALEKTVDTLTGFTAENAYHRVEGVAFNGKTEMSFRVRVYKDSSNALPAFDDKPYKCVYDMDGNNPFAQAYAYLKTQEFYQDAIDA